VKIKKIKNLYSTFTLFLQFNFNQFDMKNYQLLLFLPIFTLFHFQLFAQCTDSGKPFWSPSLPATNSSTGVFEYPSTAAKGTMTISSGSNAFLNPSTTSLVTNMAYFTKQGLQNVTITFNTLISKAVTKTATNVSMVSTNESFRLSSVGTTEGQIVSATDASGAIVYPNWASTSNAVISGANNNEITGSGSNGASEFSFAVPIKSLSIAPTATGAATSGLNVILYPVCAAASLPIELTFFKAKATNNSVKLFWQTASEKNNKGFEIERSIDTKTWENIGGVKGLGTSNVLVDYIFEDKGPLSILTYYRLKQVDFDGSEGYSNIESVALKNTQKGLKIYPNPTQNKATTLALGDDMVGGSVRIFNSVGSVLLRQNIDNQTITLDLLSIPHGLYFIEAQNGSQRFVDKLIVKN
jgi:hypothetical protein